MTHLALHTCNAAIHHERQIGIVIFSSSDSHNNQRKITPSSQLRISSQAFPAKGFANHLEGECTNTYWHTVPCFHIANVMKSFVAYRNIRFDPHALTFGQLQVPVIQISSSHSANSGKRRAVTTSSLLVDSLSKPCATIRIRSRCKEVVKFDWPVIYTQKHAGDALCIIWQCIYFSDNRLG